MCRRTAVSARVWVPVNAKGSVARNLLRLLALPARAPGRDRPRPARAGREQAQLDDEQLVPGEAAICRLFELVGIRKMRLDNRGRQIDEGSLGPKPGGQEVDKKIGIAVDSMLGDSPHEATVEAFNERVNRNQASGMDRIFPGKRFPIRIRGKPGRLPTSLALTTKNHRLIGGQLLRNVILPTNRPPRPFPIRRQ